MACVASYGQAANDVWFFFFQAEDGIRDGHVTGVQTCALPISSTVASARVFPSARVRRTAATSEDPWPSATSYHCPSTPTPPMDQLRGDAFQLPQPPTLPCSTPSTSATTSRQLPSALKDRTRAQLESPIVRAEPTASAPDRAGSVL